MALRRWAVALIAVLLAGCGGHAAAPSVAVGSRPDDESALVAHLYAAALRYYGNPSHVEKVPDPLIGLDSGDIGVAPGFTGRLLELFEPDAPARSDAQVYRMMVSSLPEGVAAGDYTTSAEDKPALAVTESAATTLPRRDVGALIDDCGTLKVGAVTGTRHPSSVGLCEMPVEGEFRDNATLFDALRAGRINAAWTSTADPGVPVDAVVLADRTALIRAENLVPLYRRNELNEFQVRAINEIAGVLDTGELTEMLRKVADGADPRAVAEAFLDTHPLGR